MSVVRNEHPSGSEEGEAEYHTSGPINRVVWCSTQRIDMMRTRVCGTDYLPTHLPTWNGCCHDGGCGEGLAMGWHVIVAANPGVGKSMLALNLAAGFTKKNATVGFLSLEMSKGQLTNRWLSIRTGVPLRHIENDAGKYDPTHYDAAYAEVLAAEEGALYVEDSRSLRHLDAALSLMRTWKDWHGVNVIIVDYMQLLTAGGGDLRAQTEEVSKSLADFAKDENIVIVGLSQFNRETSRNYESSPQIQGLYGGMVMEGDADQVVMIDHSKYEKDFNSAGILRGARTWVILGKNRHGPGGEIPVYIDYRTLRVTEALPDEEHRWPGVQK